MSNRSELLLYNQGTDVKFSKLLFYSGTENVQSQLLTMLNSHSRARQGLYNVHLFTHGEIKYRFMDRSIDTVGRVGENAPR